MSGAGRRMGAGSSATPADLKHDCAEHKVHGRAWFALPENIDELPEVIEAGPGVGSRDQPSRE